MKKLVAVHSSSRTRLLWLAGGLVAAGFLAIGLFTSVVSPPPLATPSATRLATPPLATPSATRLATPPLATPGATPSATTQPLATPPPVPRYQVISDLLKAPIKTSALKGLAILIEKVEIVARLPGPALVAPDERLIWIEVSSDQPLPADASWTIEFGSPWFGRIWAAPDVLAPEPQIVPGHASTHGWLAFVVTSDEMRVIAANPLDSVHLVMIVKGTPTTLCALPVLTKGD